MIITREDPPVPISRLRARGQLLEIRQNDLRFSLDECARFLGEVMRLDLSDDDIAALARRTEGWVVGLQLAALAMQGAPDRSAFVQSFTGSHRYILDYLLDEVLEGQPPDLQEFFLKTSILERLSAPLCDALTGYNDSRERLQALDAANLFINPLDQNREWYRYHRLFAELLRHRLRLQPGISLDELHHTASVWFEDNGFLVDANPGGLAHGIGSLLADHDHCRALGTNGRKAVETEYNWDTIAGYTEGVYNAVLNY